MGKAKLTSIRYAFDDNDGFMILKIEADGKENFIRLKDALFTKYGATRKSSRDRVDKHEEWNSFDESMFKNIENWRKLSPSEGYFWPLKSLKIRTGYPSDGKNT